MEKLKKYTVLFLALLITLSATGMSISLHKCCGKVADFTFFGSAKECKMAKKAVVKNCHSVQELQKTKSKCCQDQKIIVQNTSEARLEKAPLVEKNSFDVLLILNFVRSWFNFGTEPSVENEEEWKCRFSFPESLTILFRQFRI